MHSCDANVALLVSFSPPCRFRILAGGCSFLSLETLSSFLFLFQLLELSFAL